MASRSEIWLEVLFSQETDASQMEPWSLVQSLMQLETDMKSAVLFPINNLAIKVFIL